MNFDEELFARMIERLGGEESPRPEHRDQLRKQALEVFDRAPMPRYTVKFPKHLFSNWRYIMRQPIARVAAAIVIIIMVSGVALWFSGGGTKAAFADFVASIVEAKSAKFKVTAEVEGQPPITIPAMFLAPAGLRQELPGGMVNIVNTAQGEMKTLSLDTKNKKATIMNFANMPKDKMPKNANFFTQLQSQLSNAKENPDVKREPLGEKEIDGHQAIGYRIIYTGMTMNFWGDPKTNLPVRIEQSMDFIPNTKITWTDFQFDVNLDESLFNITPPDGYTIMDVPVDASQPSEKDLIESLRQYCEMCGGTLPDALDMHAMMEFAGRLESKIGLEEGKEPREVKAKELMMTSLKLSRGFQFSVMLPKDADAHYAGKGVSLNANDAPIFWYRPKDSKKYRVIYADLSVKESDTPPIVPNAQSISVKPSTEK